MEIYNTGCYLKFAQPVMVQVSTAGGQKTDTLVTSQGTGAIPSSVEKLLSAGRGKSKVVLPPQSSLTTTAAESAQPETVSRTQSTDSATWSISDGPATTDAALAAEAGLIDQPEETEASSAMPASDSMSIPVSIENEDALQFLARMSAEMIDTSLTLDPISSTSVAAS